MLELLLKSLGAEECLTRTCWPMDELARGGGGGGSVGFSIFFFNDE